MATRPQLTVRQPLPILRNILGCRANDPSLRNLQDRDLCGRPHATMTMRAGDVRRAADAMEWARRNTAVLWDAWHTMNRRG
jgi:hypothetical protein